MLIKKIISQWLEKQTLKNNHDYHVIHRNKQMTRLGKFLYVRLTFVPGCGWYREEPKKSAATMYDVLVSLKSNCDQNGNFLGFYFPRQFAYGIDVKREYFQAAFDEKWCLHEKKHLKYNGHPKDWLCKQCFIDFIEKCYKEYKEEEERQKHDIETNLPNSECLSHRPTGCRGHGYE